MTGEADWSIDVCALSSRGGTRLKIARDGRPATAGQTLAGWVEAPTLRSAWNAALAGLPFPAFRWELPPLTEATVGTPFECVALDDPALDRRPDPSAFAERFANDADEMIVTFPNLGGEAVLLAPRPAGPLSAYGHLAAFVRHAPAEQRDALWQAVGRAALARLSARPVWLNTAGAGVPWLHVRLDDRPKYYRHAAYRRPPG